MNVMELRLVQLSRTGDRTAFEKLVDLYKGKIHRLAYRMLNNSHDSEDVVQETFMRVYLNLNRYDDNQNFSTWIYRIGKNLCVDLLRKRKVSSSLDADISEEDELTPYGVLPSNEITPEHQALLTEQQEQVRRVINTLSDKYKPVVTLYYLHDLNIQEISEELGMPLTTVKTRLHRGRDYLRKKWGMTILLNVVIFFSNFVLL
jgi:RNA polymerase sigma-70 factor (ECF subfamily)